MALIAHDRVAPGMILRFRPTGSKNRVTIRVSHVRYLDRIDAMVALGYRYNPETHSTRGEPHAYTLTRTQTIERL